MNLMFLSQTFPDATTPARGSYNNALCRELAEDHSVRVVAPRSGWEMLKHRRGGNGAVRPTSELDESGIETIYPTFWTVPRFQSHKLGVRMSKSVARATRKWLKDQPIDGILSYWAHPDGKAALDVAKRQSVPSMCIVGGSDVLLLPHQCEKRKAEILHVLNETDRIMTVSDGLRDAVIKFGVDPTRVRTIYQGIDERHFWAGNKTEARQHLGLSTTMQTFLWVGRMVDVKQIDILLQAAAHLHRKGMRFRLYLLGTGPLASKMKRLAKDLSIEQSVKFVGSVAHEDLADWYRAADVTVLSSKSEGLPNVFRESLACGTPFVSTDVGSIREIASDAHSILVPVGDAAALADALVSATGDTYQEAANRYEARTWRDTAEDVSELFNELRGHEPTKTRTDFQPSPSVQRPTNPVIESAKNSPTSKPSTPRQQTSPATYAAGDLFAQVMAKTTQPESSPPRNEPPYTESP